MGERCSLTALVWTMLRIGAVAFGGLGAALALLQHELVERRRWPAPHDLSEALAFTKPLPGSTVVQVVAFLGWRLRGWPGAILAAAAFIAPAAALMIGAAAASAALPSTPWVRGALTGLQTTVVGVLAAAMWRLGRDEAQGALMIVLLAAFVAGFYLNAAIVVLAAGLLGAGVGRRTRA